MSTEKRKNAPSTPPPTGIREEIWNSYMTLAHKAASDLKDGNAANLRQPGESGGGCLTGEQCGVVRLLIHCVLAVEARANLLLLELKREIPEKNNFLQKWQCIAKTVGKKNRIGMAAIEWLHGHRDKLVHARYSDIASSTGQLDLPPAKETLEYYHRILTEIDCMNDEVRGNTFPAQYPKGCKRVYSQWKL